jgi:Asp-tRNA(Asn)/Glu-tRNA(Gln) amidotransferase A subunit family amidase
MRPELPADLCSLTAAAAVALIHDGKLRPEALMDAYLDRIATRDPTVQAFTHFVPAQAQAAAAAAKPGPLHGIPIGAKDVLDTSDMPSQYGSPIWANWQPKADSAPVAWARKAGAVVIGKTVTTEFATRKPGPTMNPVNPNHTPGGSSSGSAAGLGAGMFPLAYGTQTAGSVIRPAAYCGVVGYKPSYGLISRIGMKIMSDSLDTVGVIARTVADCALFAGAVSGRDLGDPEAKPGPAPRVGICRSPTWRAAAPETVALLARVTDALTRAGAAVQDRELPANFNALIEAHPIVMNNESARALGWELANHPGQISDGLRERLAFGLNQTPAALANAYAVFETTQRAFPDAMDGLDVLVTPSAAG